MKAILPYALLILVSGASYVAGQVNSKPVKNCCCEHTQQIAEDIRWLKNQMSKPYKAPPDIEWTDPGDIKSLDFTPPKIPANNIKSPGRPSVPDINMPKNDNLSRRKN